MQMQNYLLADEMNFIGLDLKIVDWNIHENESTTKCNDLAVYKINKADIIFHPIKRQVVWTKLLPYQSDRYLTYWDRLSTIKRQKIAPHLPALYHLELMHKHDFLDTI
jgi:hypothetical protein